MAKTILGTLITIVILVAVPLGFVVHHNSLSIKDKNIQPQLLIYLGYQGELSKSDYALAQIVKEIAPALIGTTQAFKFIYDKDPKSGLTRAAIGMYVSSSLKDKAEKFIAENPKFKLTEIGEIRAVTPGPYKNLGSLTELYFKYIAYPEAADYGRRNLIFDINDTPCTIYNYYVPESMTEVVVPYGQEADQLLLFKGVGESKYSKSQGNADL